VPIDLDAQRRQRAQDRAANRPVDAGEANGDTEQVVLNGKVIAELAAELPMAAMGPLQDIQEDALLLIREAVKIMTSAGEDGKASVDAAALGLFIDVLTTNPELPASLITVVQEVARELLGDDGYQAVLDAIHDKGPGRLSLLDVAALIKGIVGWYRLAFGSLGKSSTPTGSAPSGGKTSKPTSRRPTGSTRGASGRGQPTPST